MTYTLVTVNGQQHWFESPACDAEAAELLKRVERTGERWAKVSVVKGLEREQ